MMMYRQVKKVLDPVFAFLLMVLLSPVFLIIAVLVKATSDGPVIFKQKRLGHKQKPFVMYKFRVMVKGAEKLKGKYKHLDFTDGPVFKIKDDPRLTTLGKFLARTNLDELPQLFNILKGEMYFIGFRPPTPDEVKLYKETQLRRFEGFPGLTSLWAVSGMHELKFDEWIKLDVNYAKNECLSLDFKIIVLTFFNLIKRIIGLN